MTRETIARKDGTEQASEEPTEGQGRSGRGAADGKDRPAEGVVTGRDQPEADVADGKERAGTTPRPRTEAEIVAGIERGIEEEDRAEIARMFGDQRLEPEYLEPDGGFHEVKPKRREKPFSYLPLDKRAVKILRMAGLTWGEISRATRMNLRPDAIKKRMARLDGRNS